MTLSPSRGHSPSHRNPSTGRMDRVAFNPSNVHQIWPEKAFHIRKETSENCEEVQLPSSGVTKSKNRDYMMVLVCCFPHFSWSMFLSIYLHFQHSDPPFLLSPLLAFSRRSTRAERRVNACARAAGRGYRQAQITHLHAKFHSTT